MASITGLRKLLAQLSARALQAVATSKTRVIVGYTTAYAVYVHENLEQKLLGKPRPSGIGTYWQPGQPKFLEQPARELSQDGTLSQIVQRGLKAGLTPAQALTMAGLRLQRESQKLVPVEYAFLKNSAVTRVESE